MAYRIVKETLKYGGAQYRVETNNGLFGLRKRFNKWKTVTTWEVDYGRCEAIYHSLTDAELFVEDLVDHVVESEVIKLYD